MASVKVNGEALLTSESVLKRLNLTQGQSVSVEMQYKIISANLEELKTKSNSAKIQAKASP